MVKKMSQSIYNNNSIRLIINRFDRKFIFKSDKESNHKIDKWIKAISQLMKPKFIINTKLFEINYFWRDQYI